MTSSIPVRTRRPTDGNGGRAEPAAPAAPRAVRWSVRVLGTLVALLLTAGIGLDAHPRDPGPPIHSPSDQAQLDAEDRYRTLAADARTAAATTAALGAQLLSLAADLDAQADAVALPRAADLPADDTGTAGPAPPQGALPDVLPDMPAPTAATAVDVLQRLRDSTLASLLAAVDADPGPSRVLAAAGANQWRHTVLLADTLGEEASLPATGDFPAMDLSAGTGIFSGAAAPAAGPDPDPDPHTTDGASSPAAEETGAEDDEGVEGTEDPQDPGVTGNCAGTPLGSDADRHALLTARNAEEQARYAYEVAAALQPEPDRLLEDSAEHAVAADAAEARLAALCSPADPPPAGFSLGPVFRADPVAALRVLEQERADLYAGVIPTVSRAERAWAIASLTAAVQRSVAAGTPLETFPGLRVQSPVEPPDAAPTPGGGTSDE